MTSRKDIQKWPAEDRETIYFLLKEADTRLLDALSVLHDIGTEPGYEIDEVHRIMGGIEELQARLITLGKRFE